MTLLLLMLAVVAIAGLVLLVLGHFLKRDNITTSGGIAQLLGLTTIAAAVGLYFLPTWIQPDDSDLKAELATAKAELTKAKSAFARAREAENAKLAMKDGLIDQAKSRLAKADTRYAAALKAERARLAALYAAAGEANPVASDTHSASSIDADMTSDGNQSAAEQVEQRIAKLAMLLRRKTDVAAKPAADFGRVARLRDRLDYGFQTDNYSVEVYPDNEVVKGSKGKYYVVDIRNAETGTRFQLGGGKYTLSRASRSFRRGLQAFMQEVVQTVEGNVDYTLFVRGSADNIPYSGRPEAGYDYRAVKFMKAVSDGKYVNEFDVQEIGRRVRNRDLPFLRAEFLRQVVSEVYPTKPAVVLEGTVVDAASKEDRNAELILYVNW